MKPLSPVSPSTRLGILTVLVASVVMGSFAQANPTCSKIFSGTAVTNEDIPNFIERTILDLSSLRLKIDIERSRGESSVVLSALESDYLRNEKALIEFIDRSKVMTHQELIEKMRQQIVSLQKKSPQQQDVETPRKEKQLETMVDAVIDGTKLVVHRVQPGSFKMGRASKAVDVTISKPFEMAATPTTQFQWQSIVELAYARSQAATISSNPSLHDDPYFPVTSVSYLEVHFWINELNDLSLAGEPKLAELIPGHKNGDIYRLPTEAEWEFVMRNRGKNQSNAHFSDPNALGGYAWNRENSRNTPHRVAEKQSLEVDGQQFFDMHGNVKEWVDDYYESALRGGSDPHGTPAKNPEFQKYVIRGSSWMDGVKDNTPYRRDGGFIDSPTPDVGFRLVRDVR